MTDTSNERGGALTTAHPTTLTLALTAAGLRARAVLAKATGK